MANITYSEEALNDLEGIGIYIERELKNPSAARKTVNMIQDAVDKFAAFPARVRRFRRSMTVRGITVTSYAKTISRSTMSGTAGFTLPAFYTADAIT